ncbi:MAG: HAD hydrolase-like protein [Elusimicrobiota bacterium]|nr:HAD hydrolase-like protein [Elusimicrobiota bacterium]
MKVILFDIDGTLINAGSSGTRALNKVIEVLYGKSNVCDNFSLQGATDKTNFLAAFCHASNRRANSGEMKKVTAAYLKRLPIELKKSVKLKKYKKIKGVEKILKLLSKDENIFLGLGTGNIKEGAFLKLGPSGLLKYFPFGGFGDDSAVRSKLLQKAVKRAEKMFKIKVSPADVYIIGDTHKDVLAAKEAGYHSGVVLGGFGDDKKIFKSGPELITKDFSDLTSWLIWLGLKKDPKGIRRGTYVCPDTPIEHAHFGMTGMDLGDNEESIKKLRKIKNKR